MRKTLFLILALFICSAAIGGYIYMQAHQEKPAVKRQKRLEIDRAAQDQAAHLVAKMITIQRHFDELLEQGTKAEDIRLYEGSNHQKACSKGTNCLFSGTYDAPQLTKDDAPQIYYQHLNDQKHFIADLSPQNKQILILLQNISKSLCIAYNQKYGFSSIINSDNGDPIFGENSDYAGQWTFCQETAPKSDIYQIIFALYAL